MKKVSGLLVVFVCFFAMPKIHAQIPDAGFENWTAGAPTGWLTPNTPGLDTVIRQTTDAHSGTYAAEGIATQVASAVMTPSLSILMPWTAQSTTFSGYYKYSPVSGDTLIIAAVFAKHSKAIGVGELKVAAAASSYTQFSIPIDYTSAGPPDSAGIDFFIVAASGSSSVHAGSMFKIDDLSLSGATGVSANDVGTPGSYSLGQNFPNPFNPSTVIRYQLPASSQVSLKVYDVLGREVATLVDTRESAGIYSVSFDGSNLASGVYFYRLQAGNFSDMKKLTLLK